MNDEPMERIGSKGSLLCDGRSVTRCLPQTRTFRERRTGSIVLHPVSTLVGS